MINASHATSLKEPEEQYLSLGGDFLDSQLETADKVEIGRVAGIEGEWHDDGRLVLTALLTGPQALAGRVARPLRTLFQWILGNRFDHAISMNDLTKIELTLYLRENAIDYPTGSADRWIASHILRWIPGNGYKKNNATQEDKQQIHPSITSSKNTRNVLVHELIGRKIVTHEGKRVGHIFDVQVSREPEYEVVSLVYGRLAPLYRMHVLYPFAHMFHLHEQPRTVQWSDVASVESHAVRLKPAFHKS